MFFRLRFKLLVLPVENPARLQQQQVQQVQYNIGTIAVVFLNFIEQEAEYLFELFLPRFIENNNTPERGIVEQLVFFQRNMVFSG